MFTDCGLQQVFGASQAPFLQTAAITVCYFIVQAQLTSLLLQCSRWINDMINYCFAISSFCYYCVLRYTGIKLNSCLSFLPLLFFIVSHVWNTP